jgi:twitching motility protein PilT
MIEKSMQTTGKRSMRLGELLVERGLIDANQLKDSLKKQARVGGHLGSILVEMGFITTDDLLTVLSRQFGTPSADLFKIDVSPGVLKVMPLEKIKALKVIPIGVDRNSVTLAMVNPHDLISIRDIEFSLGKKVKPVVVPSSQMEAAIKSLSSHPESFLLTAGGIEKEARKTETKKAPSLAALLKDLAASPATDMLLTSGIPPCLKLGNKIWRTPSDSLTPYDCEKFARELMSEKDWEEFVLKRDCDFAVTYTDIGRFRMNLYMQRNSVSITLRHIADIVPSSEELGLPDWLNERVLEPHGLILICGPAGHGKTTSVSAVVDIINTNRRCNIITLEDPIEYLHKHKKSSVNQREIGPDAESLHEGIKHVFRQDADVIVVGDSRDADSFAVALEAADTGHLVITTLRASTAASAIEKIINIFPLHRQGLIRAQIADNLLFVLSQRLVPMKKGEGRILACGKIMNSPAVKNLIREGKTDQIQSRTMSGSKEYTSLESSLAKLYLSDLIQFEDGLFFAGDKQLYRDLTKNS